MKIALVPKKHREMIDLLQQGYSCEVVSKWLDVVVEYVIEHYKNIEIYEASDIGDEEEINIVSTTYDPYKHFTDHELETTDIKSFRKYVIDNIDPGLATNSKVAHIIKAYRNNNTLGSE